MPAPKLQRWIDLLAALLRRHYPVPFDEIMADVPAYQTGEKESVRRRFERDKDELRAFGVPLETIRDGAGEVLGYRLSRRDIRPAVPPPRSCPRAGRPVRAPWTATGSALLEHLAFEPDELAAIVEAGTRVESLGNASIADDARSALRKSGWPICPSIPRRARAMRSSPLAGLPPRPSLRRAQ